MPPNNPPSLVQLAEQILAEARLIESAIPSPPSFQTDTLASLPPSLESTRLSLIDKTELLNALIRGCSGVYSRMISAAETRYIEETALFSLHHYRIPHRVPLDGTKSVRELAREVHVPVRLLTSLLRMCSLNHVFDFIPGAGAGAGEGDGEKEDRIAHNADSRLLATDTAVFDELGMIRSEHKPAIANFFPALEKWRGEAGSGKSAWNLANGTDAGMYEWLSGKREARPEDRREERLRQFGSAMTNLTKNGLRGVRLIGEAWPWGDLRAGGLVVDVGGGNGHLSIGLATQFPGLEFVVQDTENVVGKGVGETLPEEVQGRVVFRVHDFFTEQTVKDADVYFFSNILHNWSDDDAVRILKALIPALKPGARVLVCDRLIPQPGTEFRVAEKEIIGLDLMMWFLFNAKERTPEEIRELFKRADGRLEWGGVYSVPNGLYKICEGVWKG